MTSLIAHRFLAGQSLAGPEYEALVRHALHLRAETRAGHPATPLAGRHVAIVCGKGDSASARLVEEAAGGLGAHVSHIGALALGSGTKRIATARLLGSLYDAVDCDDGPPSAALVLEGLVDAPVFLGLGNDEHPVRGLLPALNGSPVAGAASNHADLVCLIQAVLLACIG